MLEDSLAELLQQRTWLGPITVGRRFVLDEVTAVCVFLSEHFGLPLPTIPQTLHVHRSTEDRTIGTFGSAVPRDSASSHFRTLKMQIKVGSMLPNL
jgi:hypothetical protein